MAARSKAQKGTRRGSRWRANPHSWVEPFLERIREHPVIGDVCAELKLARRAVYVRREKSATFRKRLEAAMLLGAEVFFDEAARRALAGSDALLLAFIKRYDPQFRAAPPQITVNNGPMTEAKTEKLRLIVFGKKPERLASAVN